MRSLLFGAALGTVAAVIAAPGDYAEQHQRGGSAGTEFVLTPDLRIELTSEEFSDVGWISVGPHELLAVSQPQDNRLLLFDSAGRRIATVGQTGSGPGDFRQLGGARVGWIADTLWAYDIRLRRLTLISRSGQVLRSVRLPDTLRSNAIGTLGPNVRALVAFEPFGISVGGDMIGTARYLATSNDGPKNTADWQYVYVRTSGSGAVQRLDGTIPRLALTVTSARAAAVRVGGAPTFPQHQHAFSSDGRLFATLESEFASPSGGQWTVTVMRVTGDTVLRKTATFTPEDREHADHPIRQILLGTDGSVWLRHARGVGGDRWVIFNAIGTELGSLTLARGASLRQASLTHVWLLERDENDLPAVVRCRLAARH